MTETPSETDANVLVARCESVAEPDGTPCPGRLRYRWGQSDAACDTCGGRCGIAVASWERVDPSGDTAPGADPPAARWESVLPLATSPGCVAVTDPNGDARCVKRDHPGHGAAVAAALAARSPQPAPHLRSRP